MTEDAQKFLDLLKEYSGLLAAPGAMAGFWLGRRKSDAEANKLDADADAVQSDALTRQFQTLINGYEKRVADLTAEVEDLRLEVRALRQALDARPRPVKSDTATP